MAIELQNPPVFDEGLGGKYLVMPKFNGAANPDISRDCWNTWTSVLPIIPRGTAASQRIGTSVRVVSFYVHYRIAPKPRLTDSFNQPYGEDGATYDHSIYENNTLNNQLCGLVPMNSARCQFYPRTGLEKGSAEEFTEESKGSIVSEPANWTTTKTTTVQPQYPIKESIPYNFRIRIRMYAVPIRWTTAMEDWFLCNALNKNYRPNPAFIGDTNHVVSSLFWEKNENTFSTSGGTGLDPVVGGAITTTMWKDTKCIYSRTHKVVNQVDVRKLIKFSFNIRWNDTDSAAAETAFKSGYKILVCYGTELPYNVGCWMDMTPYINIRFRYFYIDT